ncbi:MAG: prolyl oligopeptidase family serine peptidase [Sulfolobales archaeon]
MSDPYEYLERISDPSVVKWAIEESDRCVSRLRETSEKIYEKVLFYTTQPIAYYFKRNRAGLFYILRDSSYKVLLQTDRESRILVDSGSLGENAVIQNYYIDPEGRVFAYYYSMRGSDVGELVVIDLERDEEIDRIKGSVYDVIFLRDAEYYYVRFYRSGVCPDGVEAPCTRVFLRRDREDTMVFGRDLPKNYFISLKASSNREKALLKISYGWSRDMIVGGSLTEPDSWRVLYDKGHRAEIIDVVGDNYIVVVYDREGFGRIIFVNRDLREIVGEQDDYLQDAMLVSSRYIVASYLRHASSHIVIYDLNGRIVDQISFREPVSVFRMYSYGEGGFIELRSFTKPYQVLEFSGDTRSRRIIAESNISLDIEIVEGFALSHDSTQIHYFHLKSPRNTKRVVIYGYGGFSIALTPNFMSWIPLLLESGIDVVIANLRGGSEYGEKWHHAGMKENKINVFLDFIAVARLFKERGYKVAGFGRSNGG